MLKRTTLQEIPHSIGPLAKRDLVVRDEHILRQLPRRLRCGGDDESIEHDGQKQQLCHAFHFVLSFFLFLSRVLLDPRTEKELRTETYRLLCELFPSGSS